MTSDKGKAFWLGIFVIIAIGTVAWLFLFLKPTVGDGKTILRIRFTNIEGVSIGTRVNFGGKPVGTVYSIKEIFNARSSKPDKFGNYYFYEVEAKVDSRVKIYNYDEIALTTQGLLGEKSIEITPKAAPAGAKPPHLITTDILYARSGDQLQAVIEDFSHMLAKVTDFVDTAAPLAEDTLDSINAAAQSVNCLVGEMLSANLASRTATAADSVSRAMDKACGVLDEITENQLPTRFAQTATSVSEAAKSIEDLMKQISDGDGTISRLINSDSLYVQLQSSLSSVEAILNDMKQYGLLYQFDRKWQRQRNERCAPSKCCESAMNDISNTIDRILRSLSKKEAESEQYQEIVGRVENLLGTLQSYNAQSGACR